MSKVDILDCTLRDASYPIAYQFTAEDTAVIAAGLEEAGFTRIEVGHGVGLGASGAVHGMAAATDEEYLVAAASALKHASFGAFCIPGIAELKHVELSAKTGAGFIRIGTDVTATATAEPFVRLAKEKGLEVSANLMKTYALPIDEVVRVSEQLWRWGADVVCVVDSAGGMLPDDVRSYVSRLRGAIGARVGYHGHNNLQLAVANTLIAIEAGAHIVDCTLRGLGRSSGNAQMEAVVMILERLGIDTGIDVYKMMDLGDKLIAPLAQGRGVDSVELVSGYAQFHSSFMPRVERAAREHGVDIRELIIRASEVDKVTVTDDIVRTSALQCERRPGATMPTNESRSFDWSPSKLDLSGSLADTARRVAEEMRSMSKKTGKRSVFTMALAPGGAGQRASFPFIRISGTYVVGNAEVVSAAEAEEITKAIDGIVDVVLIDAEATSRQSLVRAVTGSIEKSQLLTYRDSDAHLDAAEALLGHLAGAAASVGISGLSPFGLRLATRLLERGASVQLWDPNAKLVEESIKTLQSWCTLQGWTDGRRVGALQAGRGSLDVLVGARVREAVVSVDAINAVKDDGAVLDAGIGTLSSAAVDRARERGLRLYRLDMRAGLTGQVAIAIETAELLSNVVGETRLGGVDVVAGGVVGRRGAVVVDAIQQPTRVVGVANGRGELLGDSEAHAFDEAIALVRSELVRRRIPWQATAATQ